MRFCARMRDELALTHPEALVCDFGHMGNGGVHFNLVVPPDSPCATDPAAETALRDRVIHIAVRDFGGSFSAEHAIGRRNQAFYDAYADPLLRGLSGGLLQTLGGVRIGAARFD